MKARVIVTVTHATALYPMSVAAALTGAHPQTLRTYERYGLLTPARTAGGSRMYSEADVALAKRILELSNLGMTRDGIAFCLALEAENRVLREELAQLRGETRGG